MNMSLSGPGTQNLINNLSSLLEAAKVACEAYAAKAVKEMQARDVELTELHRRRKHLESEVKALEERKRKAMIPPTHAPSQRPAQNMRSGTKPLTPEQMAKAAYEAEQKAKADAAAKHSAPLTHNIKGLESIQLSISSEEVEAEQQA